MAGSHMSIGEVLSLLQSEFPDVTISKIRFLESQGLVDPERTPSGYRKFYDDDIERLRWVLRQQRDAFLPLKVIKGRLDDDTGPDEGGAEPVDLARGGSSARGGAGGGGAGGGGARASRRGEPVPAATGGLRAHDGRGAYPVPSAMNGVLAEQRPDGEPEGPRKSYVFEQDHDDVERTEALGQVRDVTAPQLFDARPPYSAYAPGQGTTSGPGKSPERGRTSPAGARSSGAGRGGAGGVAASGGGASGSGSSGSGASGSGAAGRVPRDRARGTGSAPARGAPGGGAPGGGAPGGGAAGGGAAGGRASGGGGGLRRARSPGTAGRPARSRGLEMGGNDDELALEELVLQTGADVETIEDLQRFGLITPRMVAGSSLYSQEDATIAQLASAFARHGVEARHLRAYKGAAEREAGMVQQVILPLLRQRNPEARTAASQAAEELSQLGGELRAALLRAALIELR